MSDTNAKKAQKIVNEVDRELGIALVAYPNSELEWLKGRLEKFLELEVETEDLHDADDDDFLEEEVGGDDGPNYEADEDDEDEELE